MPGLIDLLKSNYSFNNPNGVARNRMGGVVDGSDIISGAMQGLANILGGAARGSITSGLGIPGDINEAIVNNLGSLFPNAPALPTTNQWQQLLPGKPTSYEGQTYQKLGEMIPAPIPIGEFAKIAGNAINDAMVYGAGPLAKITPQPMRITTWHGSPHTFNKFDLSKIGTGEGAQAYGHGIYVAENPEVARGYANRLGKNLIMVDGKPMDFTDPVHIAASIISDPNNAGLPGERLASAIRYNPKGIVPFDAESKVEEIAKALESGKLPKFTNEKGNFYKVDLPDEHIEKMLDWDKPLSQQPKNVQKALKGIENELPTIPDFDLKKWMDTDPLASTFHNVINRDLKVEQPEISSLLASRGIPGIKYLDEQSRGAGEGTRNFVIFDPNIAKIEERNSIPIPQDPHAPNYLEDVHKALSSKFEYPREQAFKIAQENAALPVSEGGLGLPKDNTPEMRAKAMGYETPMYHGTNEDIEVFNTKGKGKTAGAGAFFTTNPTTAETYVSSSGGGNILPVMVKKNDLLNVNARGKNWSDIYTNQLGAKSGKIKYSPEELGLDLNSATTTDELGMIAADLGKKGIEIKNVKDLGPNSHVMRAKEYLLNKYGIVPDEIWSNVTGKQFDESQKAMKKFYESQKSDIVALQDPSMIRSKFAAFDPKQMGNPDLLAGVLPLSLGGATLVGANNDDVHSPNYLENLHKQLAQKPIDVTDVHAPNYLEDIHNQLANQQ